MKENNAILLLCNLRESILNYSFLSGALAYSSGKQIGGQKWLFPFVYMTEKT